MPLANESPTRQLAKALEGIDFPADRGKISQYARSHGADKDTLQLIDRLPNEQYTSMADVFKGVGMSDQKG